MRNLSLWRYAQAKMVAGQSAQPVQPKKLTSQVKLTVSHTELSQLPSEELVQVQDLDPASPTFALFYFLEGYDVPDDPNHPLA